jgi:hypothetical protein
MINSFVVAGKFVEMKDNYMVLVIPDENLLLPIQVSSEFVSYFNMIKPGDLVGVKGSFIKGKPYDIKAVKVTFMSTMEENN